MFLDDPQNRKTLTKWAVGTVAACILIFLGIRYVSAIAIAVQWLYDLVKPLLTGTILAMILNVPLAFIERHLFRKNPTPKKEKARRPLAILLSLILVIGIFVGVAVLVIPELTGAVSIVISSVTGALDQMAVLESSEDFAQLPFAPWLEKLDIDWLTMKTQVESWMPQLSSTVLGSTASALGSAASSLIDGVVAFVFCIYVLANKETLARQIGRLAKAWLPARLTNTMSHVFHVCADVFQQFIVGQTTEAVILGTLCGIGMAILRIPYAPMVGALVGVTALIPYVGAFLATIVGAFMILTVNPFKALVFVIYLLALQQVEGNLIYPKVVGAKINLPAMWVLAAITVGGNLAGPISMLLGVPAASAAYALLKEATQKRETQLMQSNVQ
ncbi:MAG: AI-2E family transporter [Oscillospiraceae bacterium]|nr:AI-2E family transporter [Oscillospiraceae bacterium]